MTYALFQDSSGSAEYQCWGLIPANRFKEQTGTMREHPEFFVGWGTLSLINADLAQSNLLTVHGFVPHSLTGPGKMFRQCRSH